MLKLPVIVSPMFLVSTPRMVIEAGKAGVIGSFPCFYRRICKRGYAESFVSACEMCSVQLFCRKNGL